MSKWQELTHFMYGDVRSSDGFWYSHVLHEIEGLDEDQLYWIPDPNALCILWHVGHIAHRERAHVGIFLQGIEPKDLFPEKFNVFGTIWTSVEDIRNSIGSVDEVFQWVQEVRKESKNYIDALTDDDFHTVSPTSDQRLSVAHWLFITAAHTALHIGRIQMLRALIEGKHERAC